MPAEVYWEVPPRELVFPRTRVPVAHLWSYEEAGVDLGAFLRDFPSVRPEHARRFRDMDARALPNDLPEFVEALPEVVAWPEDPAVGERVMSGERRRAPERKFEVACRLTQTSEALARAEARRRYPHATEREIMLRAASRRVPADLLRRAYGWDPDPEGD